MLQVLTSALVGRSPSAEIPDVMVVRCRNGRARAFSPATGGEQFFLQYGNGSWQVMAEGTGLDCADPDAGRALLRVCTALDYPTTADLDRIADPQAAADRLVDAWIQHDSTTANQLTRNGTPNEVLFGQSAPATPPEAIPCRLFTLGRFACSYVLAPHAQLSIIVEGGASAGYEVTGVEFGD
jgi:hypothetical protein